MCESITAMHSGSDSTCSSCQRSFMQAVDRGSVCDAEEAAAWTVVQPGGKGKNGDQVELGQEEVNEELLVEVHNYQQPVAQGVVRAADLLQVLPFCFCMPAVLFHTSNLLQFPDLPQVGTLENISCHMFMQHACQLVIQMLCVEQAACAAGVSKCLHCDEQCWTQS